MVKLHESFAQSGIITFAQSGIVVQLVESDNLQFLLLRVALLFSGATCCSERCLNPLVRYALNKRCALIRHARLTTRLYGITSIHTDTTLKIRVSVGLAQARPNHQLICWCVWFIVNVFVACGCVLLLIAVCVIVVYNKQSHILWGHVITFIGSDHHNQQLNCQPCKHGTERKKERDERETEFDL